MVALSVVRVFRSKMQQMRCLLTRLQLAG